MKNAKKMLALLLAMVLCLSLAACGSDSDSGDDTAEETEAETEAETETEAVSTSSSDTFVFGEDTIEGKFNPLFYTAATDDDVNSLIFDYLLISDREGAVITDGINGEVVEYNGTEYTYYAPASCDIVTNDDGSVDYTFTLREDIQYSDGSYATIDDALFALYVTLDPTYDGIYTISSLPIEGLDEYRSGMSSLFDLLVAAGEDNDDFTYWDEDTQTAFWADLYQAGEAFAQEIVDYCAAAGYAADSDDVYNGAAAWGFDVPEDADALDFFLVMCDEYGWNLADLSDVESAGSTLYDLMDDYDSYAVGVSTGESASSVSGIIKNNDYSMTIRMTELDATAIYDVESIPLLSVAYYGEGPVDADNDYFGFTKGDLSVVKSHINEPFGSGPYVFKEFSNGTVFLEANEYYWKGEPKIQYMNIVSMQEADKIPALDAGTIDFTVPSYNSECVDQITDLNGGEGVTGDVITTVTVDNLGYGYIGINASNVSVGGDGGSYESKCLRKGIATVLAVYRDEAIKSYYGELAAIINYPISNTSWAAPKSTDEGYQIAFSVDVNGDPIYTDGMSDDEKYAAALEAALGYFEAAGYTVEDGMLTAAPAGASLTYTAMVPGGGTGDHPNYMIITSARDALATIGMTIEVQDLSDGTVTIGNNLAAGTAEIWTMAWGVTADPDMYQIYYSDIANGGTNAGGSSMYYDIKDEDLDELILLARQSTDTTYRKTLYKEALDIIVDWACEIPVYQRLNAYCYSTERVNSDTVTPDITTYWGLLNDVEKLEMN